MSPADNLKRGLLIAAGTLVLDQATKLAMLVYLIEGFRPTVRILPFFDLVVVWNYGVSFGMFNTGSSSSAFLFAALAFAIVLGLVWWMRNAENRTVVLALGLVVGGAIGNVVDRLRFGAVFDFIDIHVAGWHWPAFNVADSGITIGVAVLFYDAFIGSRTALK
jgi:signal peptidase II